MASDFRSLATCGFSSHMVSKPRFEVRQASACPKKTGNTTRDTLGSVIGAEKLCAWAEMPLIQDGREPGSRHAHPGRLQQDQPPSPQVAQSLDAAILPDQDRVLLRSLLARAGDDLAGIQQIGHLPVLDDIQRHGVQQAPAGTAQDLLGGLEYLRVV